jgi:hypothetical protein
MVNGLRLEDRSVSLEERGSRKTDEEEWFARGKAEEELGSCN